MAGACSFAQYTCLVLSAPLVRLESKLTWPARQSHACAPTRLVKPSPFGVQIQPADSFYAAFDDSGSHSKAATALAAAAAAAAPESAGKLQVATAACMGDSCAKAQGTPAELQQAATNPAAAAPPQAGCASPLSWRPKQPHQLFTPPHSRAAAQAPTALAPANHTPTPRLWPPDTPCAAAQPCFSLLPGMSPFVQRRQQQQQLEQQQAAAVSAAGDAGVDNSHSPDGHLPAPPQRSAEYPGPPMCPEAEAERCAATCSCVILVAFASFTCSSKTPTRCCENGSAFPRGATMMSVDTALGSASQQLAVSLHGDRCRCQLLLSLCQLLHFSLLQCCFSVCCNAASCFRRVSDVLKNSVLFCRLYDVGGGSRVQEPRFEAITDLLKCIFKVVSVLGAETQCTQLLLQAARLRLLERSISQKRSANSIGRKVFMELFAGSSLAACHSRCGANKQAGTEACSVHPKPVTRVQPRWNFMPHQDTSSNALHPRSAADLQRGLHRPRRRICEGGHPCGRHCGESRQLLPLDPGAAAA